MCDSAAWTNRLPYQVMVRPRGVEEVEVALGLLPSTGMSERPSTLLREIAGTRQWNQSDNQAGWSLRSSAICIRTAPSIWSRSRSPSHILLLHRAASSVVVVSWRSPPQAWQRADRDLRKRKEIYKRSSKSRDWIYYREKERSEPGERWHREEQGHRESERFIVLWRI